MTTCNVKLALAAKVDDHIEIAIEADNGTKLKLKATPDKLDALIGDLETITEAGSVQG